MWFDVLVKWRRAGVGLAVYETLRVRAATARVAKSTAVQRMLEARRWVEVLDVRPGLGDAA